MGNVKVYSRGGDVVFLNDLEDDLNSKYQTVHNWFMNEIDGTSLSVKTRKTYLQYIDAICKILKKNPDQIIDHIKTAKNQNTAIKRNHEKVANALAKRVSLIRTVDLRLLALIRFYEANLIVVSRELKKELLHITSKAFKPAFKRAVKA